MKRKLLVILIAMMAIIPAAYADTTVDLTVGLSPTSILGGSQGLQGLQGTSIGFGFGSIGGGTGSTASNFTFLIGVDAEADIFFNDNHGMYVNGGFSAIVAGNSSFIGYNAEVGYAYRIFFDDFDLVVAAGPHVKGLSNFGVFGVSANVYLDYYFTRNVFLRGGAGVGMDFLVFTGGQSAGFWMSIEGPSVAIGYSF